MLKVELHISLVLNYSKSSQYNKIESNLIYLSFKIIKKLYI